MPNDEMRRELARRLRYVASGAYDVPERDLMEALDVESSSRNGYSSEDIMRLADLIEPSPSCEFWDTEEQECYSVHTARTVDRDALLALADEMISTAKEAESIGFIFNWRLYDFARRIRKALGVTS